MLYSFSSLIPNARMPDVEKALSSVNIDKDAPIIPLEGGHSGSEMFLIQHGVQKYVLRLMTLDHSIEDRDVQIACALYASHQSVGPHIHYADAKAGIILMDYIEKSLFTKVDILSKLPERLNVLHHPKAVAKVMPKPHFGLFEYIRALMQEVAALNAVGDVLAFMESVKEIMNTLEKPQYKTPQACCHNDLNPNNLIFDGTDFFFVDFEAAGVEDPYFDLATITIHALLDKEEVETFLEAYFKRDVTSHDMVKIRLMRQVSYAFYALHFFKFAYGRGVYELDRPVPSLASWNDGMISGIFTLTTPKDWLFYAQVLMEEASNDA